MEKYSEEKIAEKLKSLEGWSLKNGAIEKSFEFKDFKEAFSAMTQIAFECEAKNHHPEWSNVYNSLTVRLNTHDADGITHKDFDLAKIIDRIATH